MTIRGRDGDDYFRQEFDQRLKEINFVQICHSCWLENLSELWGFIWWKPSSVAVAAIYFESKVLGDEWSMPEITSLVMPFLGDTVYRIPTQVTLFHINAPILLCVLAISS